MEHYFQRYDVDYSTITYRYFLALGFWLEFFSKNSIDYIFSGWIEHGSIFDSLVMDVAKFKGIQVYKFEFSTGIKNYMLNHIFDYNKRKIVNLNELNFKEEKDINLNNYATLLNKSTKIGFKNPFLYFLKTRIFTLPGVFENIIRNYKLDYKRAKKYANIYRLNRPQIFKFSNYVARLTKFYRFISSKPNMNENYIYYALHQEPEASFMARSVLNSQLFIIYMLASSLPKGYKLYVKEHPAQFFVYEKARYFLCNIDFYRTPLFYTQIKDMPNVVLCDMNTNSWDLINNSKAVASIAGSTLIEGIRANKPILNFGEDKLSFTGLLKDCFNVNSRKSLQKALQSIEKGFMPDYSDLASVIKNYVFLHTEKQNLEFEKKKVKLVLSLLEKKNDL